MLMSHHYSDNVQVPSLRSECSENDEVNEKGALWVPSGFCIVELSHSPNQRFSLPVIHAIEEDYHLPVRAEAPR
jgi:hypothetical protein